MKNLKYVSILVLIGLVLFGCKQSNQLELSGTIKGKITGDIVLKIGDQELTAPIVNNEFRFKRISINPDLAGLIVGGKEIPVFVENGPIQVIVFSDSIDKSIISGSSAQDVLNLFKKSEDEFIRQMQNLPIPQGENARKESMAQFDKMFKNRKEAIQDLINKYLNSPVAPNLIYSQFRTSLNPEELQAWLNQCSTEVVHTKPGKKLQTYIENKKRIRVGEQFIDFSCENMDGKEVKLSSVIACNKLIILDFWASWCQPCRAESKKLLKVYERLHDKGLEVLSVSIDKNREKWLRAVEQDGLVWRHVCQGKGRSEGPAALYNVDFIPAIFVISGEGKFVAIGIRDEALANFCENYLEV